MIRHSFTRTIALVLAATFAPIHIAGADDMTQDDIRNGYISHAAKAQYHRWYQLYERPEAGLENALDILDADVTIKSGLGEGRGHDEYAARIAQLPTTWQNAHFPKVVDVTVNDDGTVNLVADISYLNVGIAPDGAVRQADLTYTTQLSPTDDLLPKFTNIEIAQNSEGTAETFEDAYPANRLKSLLHYWLAIIEDPKRDPAPVQEILADDFKLNFSSGVITDFDGFKEWLAGPGSQIEASTHEISNFSYTATDDQNMTLQVDFDWSGILPNGDELVAKTRHNWVVVNDVTERFARIKEVNVEVLEDFRPKE